MGDRAVAHGGCGGLQACREGTRKGKTGWEHQFAEARQGDPHRDVHDHLHGIYRGSGGVRVRTSTLHRECVPNELLEAFLRQRRGP